MTHNLIRKIALSILCVGVMSNHSSAQTAAPLDTLDATVVMPDGMAYFFHDKKVSRFDIFRNKKAQTSRIDRASMFQKKLPTNIDAGLIHAINKKAYFFKGNTYYRYDFFKKQVDKEGTVGVDGWKGISGSIDAVFSHPTQNAAYFFQGDKYHKYSYSKRKFVENGRIGVEYLRGVPKNLDAAMMHSNGMGYFFKGDQYYRFDFNTNKVNKQATVGKSGWKGLTFARGTSSNNDNESYEEEERAAEKDTDYCGPEFLTENLGSYLGNSISGPFLNACKQHDACYRIQKKSQRFCDNQFSTEMEKVCARKPLVEYPRCRTNAAIFGGLVESTIGGYAYGGAPQGKIIKNKIERKVTKDIFSDDEVDYCVTIQNDSQITQEYELRLLTSDNALIDREPDTHELNVLSNDRAEICVGTNTLPDWSQSDLTSKVIIQLLADTPDTWDTTNDMVVVDFAVIRGR